MIEPKRVAGLLRAMDGYEGKLAVRGALCPAPCPAGIRAPRRATQGRMGGNRLGRCGMALHRDQDQHPAYCPPLPRKQTRHRIRGPRCSIEKPRAGSCSIHDYQKGLPEFTRSKDRAESGSCPSFRVFFVLKAFEFAKLHELA